MSTRSPAAGRVVDAVVQPRASRADFRRVHRRLQALGDAMQAAASVRGGPAPDLAVALPVAVQAQVWLHVSGPGPHHRPLPLTSLEGRSVDRLLGPQGASRAAASTSQDEWVQDVSELLARGLVQGHGTLLQAVALRAQEAAATAPAPAPVPPRYAPAHLFTTVAWMGAQGSSHIRHARAAAALPPVPSPALATLRSGLSALGFVRP